MPKNIPVGILFVIVFAGLLAAAAPVPDVRISKEGRASIDAALKYLAARQNDDGSWDEGSYGRPTASAALAGLAFMSDGHMPGRGAYGENVSKALDYVLASAQPNGLLEYGAPHYAMYSHGYATLFLAEAWGMTARSDIRDKLKSAVDLIVRTQNREGGWRYEPKVADADISVTIVQIVALRAAANAGIAVSRDTVDNAVEYLRKCAQRDGGFSYQAGSGQSGYPRSGGALVCFALTGNYAAPEIPGAVHYLQANRRYRGGNYFYGQYYAAQGMHLVAPHDWPDWYGFITGDLKARQSADGSWDSSAYSTAMGALVLTIPNGYLPLYQR